MFGAASTANKKRGSVGTVTTAATSTSIPTTLLGSQPAAASTSFFGAQPAATSAPTNLFGAQTSTAATTTTTTTTAPSNSLFGTPPTSTAAPTNSLFGSQPASTTTTSTTSLFGAKPASTPATTTSFFGAQPATTTTNNSLFGSSTTNNSLFQTTNNQQQPQQQQQQGKEYLSLDNCFPDTKVPHFVVTPDRVTRTVAPANFLRGPESRDFTSVINSTDVLNTYEPLSGPVGFNERITTLPNYLTSFDNTATTINNNKSPNNFPFKKRVLEDEDMGRNTLSKNTTGIFSSQQNMTYGFDKNLNKQENQDPPIESVKDIGLQSYISSHYSPPTSQSNMNNTYNLFSNTSSLQSQKTKVRVFGFDKKNIDKITKYFSSLGELSSPFVCQGNWIIFDYVSHETAVKAIQCNGMNIDQDHLIGVTWDDRAEEVEYLRYQRMNESLDLYKKPKGFLNIFNNFFNL